VECQFSVENVKGQGHRTTKTSTAIRRHVYLRTARQALAAVLRHNLLPTPETLDNGTDGRISCRNSAPTSFLVKLTWFGGRRLTAKMSGTIKQLNKVLTACDYLLIQIQIACDSTGFLFNLLWIVRTEGIRL